MDPHTFEIIKGIVEFVGAVFFAIGGFWCKSMAEDIKQIKIEQAKNDVLVENIKTRTSEREKLQDERWEGLKKDIASLHKDISLLVTTQISTLTTKLKERE